MCVGLEFHHLEGIIRPFSFEQKAIPLENLVNGKLLKGHYCKAKIWTEATGLHVCKSRLDVFSWITDKRQWTPVITQNNYQHKTSLGKE